jgi:hypothetical protein
MIHRLSKYILFLTCFQANLYGFLKNH